MKAIWNGQILAESNNTKEVESNHYFPPESLNCDFLQQSPTQTTCPWKGKAKYFHIEVEGDKNEDAAWFYPHPTEKAAPIKNHVAFWKGVKIEE